MVGGGGHVRGYMHAPDEPGDDKVTWFDERGGTEREGGGDEPDEEEADAVVGSGCGGTSLRGLRVVCGYRFL